MSAPRPPAREAETIVIVDDEAMVAMSLRSFFELETSYNVLTFNAASEALECVQAQRVHVVIADFMMPGMDGITLLERVRDCSPLTTRVLLTGYADKDNAIRAINQAGLYHYLEKPWDNEHLKLIVRNAIERSALFMELDSRVSALESSNRDLHDLRTRLMRALT
jgi:DNA-binding NtrC family response regulator